MADSTQPRGRDTFVWSGKPDTPYAKVPFLKLTSGVAKVFVYLPLPGIRGRTIEQAILSVPVKDSAAAQTLTATPVDADWGPRKTTWNTQPPLRSGAVSQAQTAKVDGERFEIDVTAYVQSVANGAKHYGWCITTNSTADNRVYGFESSDHGSWLLTVDYIEAPKPPTDLAPNGGVTAVMPVLTSDFTDLGGASTEMAALNDQVNSTASASGAWDSGEVAATEPSNDLAVSTCPVPSSGATRYWRRRVKDGAGYWSAWSDWASFIYSPKPALVIDNPATGLAWDPTPTIAAHISSGVIKAWRIRVAKGNDKSRVLYDSGKKPGNGTSSLAHTIPFRDPDTGRRILKDDDTYWLSVRVWDRNDREATPGDPTYIQQWTQFTLDDDATPPPPELCLAVQIGDTPRIRVTWQRSTGFPEGWVIRRDGEVIARLDPDEVTTADNGYSWVDSTAAPFVDHVYTVKVIDGGKQSKQSPEAYILPEANGLWLLDDDTEVAIRGTQVEGFRSTDRRATYQPLNSPYDVDVVYARGTMTAPFAGTIDSTRGRDAMADRDVIESIGDRPHRVVQLVYGTRSIPVRLRDVSVDPHESFQKHNMAHAVTFTAVLAGE